MCNVEFTMKLDKLSSRVDDLSLELSLTRSLVESQMKNIEECLNEIKTIKEELKTIGGK